MLEHAYSAFLKAQSDGRKADAKRHVRAFTASFASLEEKADWVWANWRDLRAGGSSRIRHEIWADLLLPVFQAAYAKGDLESVIALAECEQNWLADKEFQKDHGLVSASHFWNEAFSKAPSDPRVRAGLLQDQLRRLALIFHEWPAGLVNVDYAVWQDEVINLKTLIESCRQLDAQGIYLELCQDYNQILEEFSRQMRSRTS